MSDFTNEEFLAALRDAQGRQRLEQFGTFTEWRQDQDINKARGGGGTQSSLAHYSPGFGMMGSSGAAAANAYMTGPPGNTTSRAPSGPRNRPEGKPGLGWKPPASRQPYDGPSFSTEPWFGNVPGQQFGVQAGVQGSQPSQYNYARPNQPPPWIDDVNLASIWYCYDDQTEILTDRRGWQPFAALTDADMVATMEPGSGRFVWQQPTERPTFDYVGELLHFTTRGLDLLVTPNHRMVVDSLPRGACAALGVPSKQGKGTFLVPASVLAATITHHVKVPVIASEWLAHDLPTMMLPSDRDAAKDLALDGVAYAAFMGLYLSEGSTHGNDQVRIWQKRDSARLLSMAKMLESIFGERVSYIDHLGLRDDPGYFVIYSTALVRHLAQFGGTAATKTVPLAIRNASKRCIEAFLVNYMLGDGEYAEDQSQSGRGSAREMRLPPQGLHGRITTASKNIADSIQEMAVKIGYSARIEIIDRQELVGHKIAHPDGSYNEIKSVQVAYRVRIVGTPSVGNIAVSRQLYAGPVYCVCVPHNIVYVRRNGMAAWCGNSPFEPIWPFGPPYYTVPREWNFPVGYNLNYIPKRLELMGMLRGMRQSWGVLAAVIETRKDQLLQVPWTIQVRGKPRQESKWVDKVRQMLRRPDGKLSYGPWTRKYLDDLFVLDAPTVFFDRTVGGEIRQMQVLDGATIFPLIDDVGRRPDTAYQVSDGGIVYEHRQPAFQQIIYGLPMINLSEDEILYGMMRPRPELPVFGFSPVEQILTEATEAIRKTFYQLEFWRCYDQETEVLTKRGWLKFAATTLDDEFATRNPRTKAFEWQRATERFHEFYRGKMVRFAGQKIDLLVTPNHKMILSGLPRALGGNTWRKGEVEVQAQQLLWAPVNNCGVPITSAWAGVEVGPQVFEDTGLGAAQERDERIAALRASGKTLAVIGQDVGLGMQTVWENLEAQKDGWVRTKARPGGAGRIVFSGDDFCAFMGMWLAEGWVHNGKVVYVAQKQASKGYLPFRALLMAILGTEPHYDGNGWEFDSVHLAAYLAQFGHAPAKFVPELLMNATPKQIELFFHYYYLGDGGEQTKIMYTASRRMADQFVELAQKMGRNASLLEDDRRGKPIWSHNGCLYGTANVVYGVRIYEAGEYTKGFGASIEDYADYVSCVTVPNGTLFVRRNNKAVWSGNSGSMPELMVTVPDVWTPRQIATFQAHFDALLSGQLSLKSKVRFIPGGMKPFDIKNASGESLWSQRDELLVRLVCYAYSVSPTPFMHQTNRATANNAQEQAQKEGLFPLMSYWKDDVMDSIIQERCGFDDVEFVFQPSPEADGSKQATIHQIQLHDGSRTINEVRAELGLEAVEDGNHHLIYTGSAVLRLDQVISGEAVAPGAPTPQGEPTPASPSGASSVPIRGPAKPVTDGSAAPPLPTRHGRLNSTPVHKISHEDVAAAAAEADRDPSKMARKLGNYKKGHISLYGLPLTIENAKGSKRGEKDRFGVKRWVTMPAAYGYIRGTLGADGMQVDCYIGKHPASAMLWVIDQDKFDTDGEDKGFDEHKVMLGYKSEARAIKDYLASHYDGHGHERLAAITALTYPEFKIWLKKGDMKRPISEQQVGHVVARRGDGNALVAKGDTVSQSTGLLSYDYLRAPASAKLRRKLRKNKLGPQWLSLAS